MLGTLCTLITALTCVSGVTVVIQKPSVVTLRKGETATMDCNLGTVTNSAARWYKQFPGGVPQYVIFFYHGDSSPFYGTGFSSPKFTSTHQSTSDYRLIINNVEEGDSAVYYCQTWDSSAHVDAAKVLTQTPAVQTVSTGQEAVLNCNTQRYDGEGVQWYKQCICYIVNRTNNESVTVMLCINDLTPGYLMNVLCVSSGSSLPPPVLTVFPPSSAELQSNKASLVCLSSQSVPFADVSWLLGGSPVSSGISTSTAVQQADQTFQISSYLAVQTSDWNMDKVYTCVSGVTVLTQKPPVVTLRKGETATMDCNLGNVNDAARWYKQIPGGVPQYVLYFYHSSSSPTYGSGFSSPKFTSTHQSTSDYRLIINNVEEGDSAVYYCHTWDSSASVSGVTVVTQKPPVVTLRKGETANLECNAPLDGARWYKQTPGRVPQFVLIFDRSWSSPKYGSGFSSPKFTSATQSTSDYRLLINNVEEGDSAVYYCHRWDDSAQEVVSQ
ncbi:hypothetical protein ABVT39_024701 [Epinephelus coioides]